MKTTITLKGEEAIREMLEQTLMLETLNDYADSMASFYWYKAKDLLNAMGDETAKAKVHDKYGELLMDMPSDKYAVLSALENCETARSFTRTIDWFTKQMVNDLTQNPATAECADRDDDDAISDAWLDISGQVWNRFADDVMKRLRLGDLWGESAGHNSREEYGALLDLYLGEDRR